MRRSAITARSRWWSALRSLLVLVVIAAQPAAAQDGAAQDRAAQDRAAQDRAERFATYCAACHGDGGAGTPGLAPPLTDPALWSGMGAQADLYVAGVVLNGLSGQIRSGGQLYAGLIMPPQAHVPDEDIALIGTYLLRDLGGVERDFDAGALETVRRTNPSHADLLAMRPEIE